MFNLYNSIVQRFSRVKTGETNMTASISEHNGLAILHDRTGELLGTYSRRRDAVRGAKRRGLVVA